MPKFIFIYAFLMISFAVGCAPAPITREPLKTAMPPLKSEWTVKMTHSGGIMGLMRSIEVSSDGKYTVIDERMDKTVTKQLPENELSKLQEIVSSTEYSSPERSGPSACADCFIYNLEIQEGNGKKFNVQVDDISMPDSHLEILITYLRNLIEAESK